MAALPPSVLDYVNRGWPVTPLRTGDKVPKLLDWVETNRTTHIPTLESWQVKNPNWGIVLGKASGIMVLDIDVKHSDAGKEWYLERRRRYGTAWENTLRVTTWSGGWHNYYLWTDELPTIVIIPQCVELRGQGAQAVIPGSVVNGVAYRVTHDPGMILPAPQWLLEEVAALRQMPPANGQWKGNGKIPSGQGARHKFIYSTGKRLRKAGLFREALITQLNLLSQERFAEPYSVEEIIHQVDSIEKDPRGEPEMHEALAATVEVVSEVQVMAVDFLWAPYIPLGTMSMMTGDPGVGKSCAALSVAADATRAGHNVLYFSNENPVAQVVRPRFEALRGDCTKLYHNTGVVTPTGKRPFEFSDVLLLEELIQKYQPILTIFDPIQSYFGPGNSDKFTETRRVLDPILTLSEKYNTAILLLRHAGKDRKGKRSIHMGLGSIDFSGVVRSEMYLGETNDKQHKAMVHIKHNLSIQGKSLEYRISGDHDGVIYQAGYFEWVGETSLAVFDLTEPEKSSKQDGELQEAMQFLRAILHDGPVLVVDIFKQGKDQAISQASIRRAKKELAGEVDTKKRFGDKQWEWYLRVLPPT